MPRPNRMRTIAAEQTLSKRVAFEREARGWTYESLAARMTDAGCAINASAIYKIEKSDPPRRITVDELMGFSRAFGIPVGRMLMPPEIAAKKEALALWSQYEAALSTYLEARGALDEIESRLLDLVDADQTATVMEALEAEMGEDAAQTITHMRLIRGFKNGER